MKIYSKPELKELGLIDIILASSGEEPTKKAKVDGKSTSFSPEGTDVMLGAINVSGNEAYFLDSWKK